MTARGAFVVQVSDEADLNEGRLDGRVEHVLSGQSAHFDSAEDLVRFITTALVQEAPATQDRRKQPE